MRLAAVERATLDEGERRTLESFVAGLERELGESLVAAWLYGSRARGQRPHAESDVDVMVVSRGGGADRHAVQRILFAAAESEGTNPLDFSVKVVDPDWLAERRRIQSFFIQEVDRDKLVLSGGR